MLIPEPLVTIQTDRSIEYAILVEKNTQKMLIYSFDQSFREVASFNCSTGEMDGSKSQSGDRKTPEGVYFFTQSFTKRDLTPIYGTRAFPIDYPNYLDRFAGKNGSAIWVHGTNKALKPKDTNGCIAMVNSDINKLDQYISLHRTPIIIQNSISYVPIEDQQNESTLLKAFLVGQSEKLLNSDAKTYFKPYNYLSDYLPAWWTEWESIREQLKQSYDKFSITFKNILIFKHDKIYVAIFDQILNYGIKNKSSKISMKDHYVGTFKLFLVKAEDDWKIVGSEYQVSPYLPEKKFDSDTFMIPANRYPIVAASNAIKGTISTEQSITEMIDSWLTAWSSKDIEQYGQFYSEDFRAKGKDRDAWIKYKDQLSKNYDFIKVTRKNIKIKPGKKFTKVSFEQIYVSSGYKAVGTKNLLLKRSGDQWKIYRETWEKL